MSEEIITKPKVEIEQDLLEKLSTLSSEEGQVVLHFLFESNQMGYYIRIWPTTYLFDNHSEHRSELIHLQNISHYPTWTWCKPGSKNYFTLIFSGLPKNCTTFDFIEECNGHSGAFEIRNIARNNSDVYYLKLHS
jgi:hypothetical protein